MTTTLAEKNERLSSVGQLKKRFFDNDTWARACAGGGAAVWAALAIAARVGVARIGAVELIFLSGPLVIVPLGIQLARVMSLAAHEQRGGLDFVIGLAQPVGSACAVIALLLRPGRVAGLIACGWLGVCLLAGGIGVLDAATWWSDAREGARATLLSSLALLAARMDLIVGGSWLVASRLGMRPLGIQEPIGLLTAVHFHFAGFATAMIAAAMLRFEGSLAQERWLTWIVPFVIGMPYVVAIGFVVSAALKMVAAVIFSLSVAGLAVLLRSIGKRAQQPEARVLLQVGAGAVFAGMVLSSVYAVLNFRGSDVLTIPQMARTHGILNAVGFCMAALLGWVIEFDAHKILNRRER
jgi:YndJ-like protein